MLAQLFLHYKTTLNISPQSWNMFVNIVWILQMLITKNIKFISST